MGLNTISYKDFVQSIEEIESKKIDGVKNNDKSQNSHMISAKNVEKRTMWDDLSELPVKADHISKKFRLWMRKRKNLFFYKRYLDRVQSGLYERYGSEAQVLENHMIDDPVEILKGPAQQYIKVIVDEINNLYQEVLNMSKALETQVSAEKAINVVNRYCQEYIGQNIKGEKVDQDKTPWKDKLLNSTKYKIAKILLRNGERKVYGYTMKSMVLKGYPKPNHLIVTLFVEDPEHKPEVQPVNAVFKSVDSFEILADSDKQDIFNVENMTKSVLEKTVDNKVMNTIKISRNAALSNFKNAKLPDKKDDGRIIDSIWDGINLSCKELLSRKKYIIECINIYYDMILRIDNLAVNAIKDMLDTENKYRDKKYQKHLNVSHRLNRNINEDGTEKTAFEQRMDRRNDLSSNKTIAKRQFASDLNRMAKELNK